MPVGPIVATGGAWFSTSSVVSTYCNTAFLNAGGTSMGLTVTRIMGAALFGSSQELIMLRDPQLVWNLLQSHLRPFFWPAVFLFLANFTNCVALQRTGITVTYVTKSATPVATALMCMLKGQRLTLATWLSIMSIVAGVGMANIGYSHFNLIGFAAAVLSTVAQSGLNVAVKGSLKEVGVTGAQAHFVMCTMISSVLLPATLATQAAVGARRMQLGESPVQEKSIIDFACCSPTKLQLLALATAAAYHVEYSLQFAFNSMVSPISISICDALRRIAIVVSGRAMFGGAALTRLNVAGALLAIFGTVLYSLAPS